jgi:hypothetical protein
VGELVTYAFEIPAYQRAYAWEEDQVRELLDDLFHAMNDDTASGGMYFLGSIVLIKSPNDPLYAEAARRSGTFLDNRGRPVVKIVLCGADADL